MGGIISSRGNNDEDGIMMHGSVEAHRHSITFIKFLGEPGEELLVTGSEDRSLRLWDFGSRQKYAKRWKSEGLKTGCASSRHEEVEEMEKQHRREGKRGGQARRDVASIQCPLVERKREGHEHWVTCADMDVRFGVVYSGSMDRNVKAWDAFTGQCLRTYVGHIDWINSVHVRGDIVYSCSDEGHVRLWRVASLLDAEDDDEQIDCWEEHSSPVKHLVGAGPRLITADVSGVVKCWDADALIHTGSLSSTMAGVGVVTCMDAPYWRHEKQGIVVQVAGSKKRKEAAQKVGKKGWANGSAGGEGQKQGQVMTAGAKWKGGCLSVFVGGSNAVVKWIEMRRRTVLGVFEGHQGGISGLQVLDGTLFTASQDKTIRAWSVSHGKCLQIYSGHLHEVKCLCVSPGGIMVSGGGDVRVWNVGTGQVFDVLEWQQRVECVALCPRNASKRDGDDGVDESGIGTGRGSKRDDDAAAVNESQVLCGLSGRLKGLDCRGYISRVGRSGSVLLPLVYVQPSDNASMPGMGVY